MNYISYFNISLFNISIIYYYNFFTYEYSKLTIFVSKINKIQ